MYKYIYNIYKNKLDTELGCTTALAKQCSTGKHIRICELKPGAKVLCKE